MGFGATRSATIALASFGMVLGISSTALAGALPVQNLTFSIFSGPASPKGYFATNNGINGVNPANWQLGSIGANGSLVFVDAPGTSASTGSGPNSYATYLPNSDTPPPGGNFVQADGNPTFDSVFFQSISGLSIGTSYTLTFWQAASQQQGFSGATTEQWIVALGANPLTDSCPSDQTMSCTYSDPGATIQTSNTMDTASQSFTDWNLVTMNFTASAPTETLSFLAWGDGGSQQNLPPTLFLAGVNTPAVPEPTTLSLFGAGALGFGFVRRWRAKRKAQA